MLPIFLAILSFLTDLRDLRKSKDFSTDFPNPVSSQTCFSFQLVQYPHQHQQDLQFRLRVSLRLIFTLVCTCVCFYVRFNWITCCLISNTTSSRIYTLTDKHGHSVTLTCWITHLSDKLYTNQNGIIAIVCLIFICIICVTSAWARNSE